MTNPPLFPAPLLEERPAPPVEDSRGPLFLAMAYYLPGKRWSQQGRLTRDYAEASRALDRLNDFWVCRRIYQIGDAT